MEHVYPHQARGIPAPGPWSRVVCWGIMAGYLASLLNWVWQCPSSSVFLESFRIAIISLHAWSNLPDGRRLALTGSPYLVGVFCLGWVCVLGDWPVSPGCPFYSSAVVHRSLAEPLCCWLQWFPFISVLGFWVFPSFNLSQRFADSMLPSKQASEQASKQNTNNSKTISFVDGFIFWLCFILCFIYFALCSLSYINFGPSLAFFSLLEV